MEKKPTINDLWQRSEITGIPQIARSRGFRRYLKIGIFLLVAAGFGYQTYSFAVLYYFYPVVLEVEVTRPELIPMPALTICTGNSIHRRRYCSAYPDHCTGNESHVKPEYANVEETATSEMYRKFGIRYVDLEFLSVKGKDGLSWVVPREVVKQHVLDLRGRRHRCFAINQKAFEPKSPDHSFYTFDDSLKSDHSKYAGIVLLNDDRINFRQGPLMSPQVAIHSPYQLINPFIDGKSFEIGKLNIFQIIMTTTNLLPAPYETDCMDYLGQQKGNTSTFPSSRNQCIYQCIFERTVSICGCMPFGTLHVAPEVEYCETEDQFSCLNNVEIEICYNSCKPDCKKFDYSSHLTSQPVEETSSLTATALNVIEKGDYLSNVTGVEDFISIGFLAVSNDVLVYTYAPKYKAIEFFMYVGGYLGIWLGISVIEIVDFFDIIAQILMRTFIARRDVSKVVAYKN